MANPRLIAAAFVVASLSAPAQTTVAQVLEKKTMAEIEELDRRIDGVIGVVAIDLTSGAVLRHNADAVFAQASLIKAPLLAALFRETREGRLDWAARYTLSPQDAVGGSGLIQKDLAKGPVTLTLRELATAMIQHSDNTATNRIIQLVSMARVNALMDSLKLPDTRLRRVMMDTPAAQRNDENTSTPMQMATLFRLLYEGKLLPPDDSRVMIQTLKLVKANLKDAAGPGSEVASKDGDIPGVRTEAGIVFLKGRPYAAAIMACYLANDDNPLPAIARIVHRHFERLANSNQFGHKVQ
jgi:beta-lactamase class A